MRLVHLSDLHFGHHDEEVVETLRDEIETQNPDIVVVSGDFTQIGSRAEFVCARRFIESLSAPVFAVPGNHDVPERNIIMRFFNPYGHYRRFIDPELEPFLHTDGIAMAGLKTSRAVQWRLDWSDGAISRDQLAELKARFDEVPDKTTKIVVAHHPLMHPEEAMMQPQKLVRRADIALKTFAEIGVRLVLSGHFHMSYVRRHAHAGEIGEAAPSGPRESATGHILVAQAASATSTRLRGHANAYNLIDICQGEIEISVREWAEDGWRTYEKAREAA